MAAFTGRLTIQLTMASGGDSDVTTYSGSGLVALDEAIPDDSSDLLVAFELDYSEIQLGFIRSDQDVIVKTNSSGAPDDTFALTANTPMLWFTGSPVGTQPTADITSLYVTNSSGATANLEIQVITDVTP